jgi:catechol 2,3-dioxygenase-like lactoylglutathione lyase family enzyme
MKQSIALTALLVRDYDEAIEFYVGTLAFRLAEDTYIPAQDKRWVVVTPPGSESGLLLARATNPEQASRIGNQTGERPFEGRRLRARTEAGKLRFSRRVQGFVRKSLGPVATEYHHGVISGL